MHNHEHIHNIDDKSKDKTLHRLKIVRGHIDSIIRMVQEDRYCVDVIHQSLAVQKALRKVDTIMMENHLKTCVIDQVRSGDESRTVEEIKKLFELK